MRELIGTIPVLVLAACLFAFCAGCQDSDDGDDDDDQAASAAFGESKLYEVAGTDSLHGDYAGQVEMRPTGESPGFIRLIHYDDLSFPDPMLDVDYQVHAAWTGDVDAASGTLRVELQVADFMVRYGDIERTEVDSGPVIVEGSIAKDDDGVTVKYQSAEGSSREFSAEEAWILVGESKAEPIFVNRDELLASHDPMPENLRKLLFAMLSGYHSLPFYDDYRDRVAFKLGVHYFAHYRTDFEWLRGNPGAIRLVNKWPDEIAMAEAMLRARGFGPTLGEKAAAFDRDMPEIFLNELGMVSSAEIGSDPLEQDESGDGLLWTGCYLGGQAYRYLETGEQEALDNWLDALDALFLCHDVVQDPASFARSVRPHVDDGAKEWVHADSPYDAYDWLCCGNNDMIQGLFYGYIVSWLFLPDDPEYDVYREGIAERAARLADSDAIANDEGFNEIKATLLAYVTTDEQGYLDRYEELFTDALKLWAGSGNGMFYIWGVSDWSGQHLNTIGTLSLWYMAQAADVDEVDLLQQGWINGMRTNGVTRQVLWPIAAYSFTDPPADLDPVLDEAIWAMRELPYPKQRFEIDQRIDPKWCASPLPNLFWKLDWMTGGRHQGLYSPPFFERDVSTNYFVAGAFDFDEFESDWTDGGGPDYLHAYWLGRYYGIIDPGE